MNTDIDHVVERLARPGPELGEGAHDLMNEIMTLEAVAPAPRRRRTLRVALPLIAGTVAAALAGVWFLGPAAAPANALDIRREGDRYVIEVKDLYADPEKYQAQLRAVGLNVTLRVAPSSPSIVGSVFPTTTDEEKPRYLTEIEQIQGPGPCVRPNGCPVGIKIPVDFKFNADITLNREALPGEEVMSAAVFDRPGEPMHCVPYLGKTVAEMRTLMAQRGWAISEFYPKGHVGVDSIADEPQTKPEWENIPAEGPVSSVPDNWFVFGGSVTHGGKAALFVSPEPVPQEEAEAQRQRLGC